MKIREFIFFSLLSFSCFSQSDKEIIQEIQTLDTEFWKSYNSCNTINIAQYIYDDIEFYHDKGGITLGKENLVSSIKNNLCSNNNYKIRRELVKGTEHFSTLYNQEKPYGLIHSGEHIFLLTINQNREYADGKAKFIHLWLLENNLWKMKRIYSYNHQPIK
ncbi:nuclear transport factor 2 family protein [Flavobacterium columnare]|uniref:nuclear transport factor 2 family protein n=1 Tax=Flavobacterium columnare TaxID=996 RepID=UPI0013D39051|nr:nuclear transport factor 2 family protein [Flavobacterium columnare]